VETVTAVVLRLDSLRVVGVPDRRVEIDHAIVRAARPDEPINSQSLDFVLRLRVVPCRCQRGPKYAEAVGVDPFDDLRVPVVDRLR
jgi:hypothetical protein